MRFKFWDRTTTTSMSSSSNNSKLLLTDTHSNTTNNTNNNETDCFICLEHMKPTDLAHPLMCENCHFNLCCTCLEMLYGSASCPNCRSNISHTIGDTILLRKVDDMEQYQEWCKPIVSEASILKEIANARYREAKFWSDIEQERRDDCPLEEDHDDQEHGFEVDVRVGPHVSIKLPVEKNEVYENFSHKIDVSLLAGVESVMSVRERETITRLFTSGDPNELAMAASALAHIAKNVLSKQRMSLADNDDTPTILPELSIYELIQDGKRARRQRGKQQQHNNNNNSHAKTTSSRQALVSLSTSSSSYVKYYTQKAAQNRATDRQVQRRCAILRQFPLPTRMPKTVQAKPTMTFVDSIWDGTLQDAYDNNSYRGGIQFQCSADTIDSHSNHNSSSCSNNIRIDTPRSRIVLANAGKQGECPGDVVTHMNGTPITVQSAAELQELLTQKKNVMLTLNADLAVAEVLKRRHAAMRHCAI